MSSIDKEYLIFGKYACIRRLAVGGMGEIFLAQQHDDIGIDRLVIIKSLLPELARDPNFTQQFLDEARVASHLNHPNIVSIYDVGLWRSLYFIAMEYIQGITLAQLMRNITGNQQHVPYSLSAKVIMDACLALRHVREATDGQGKALNIVHRDISP